MVCLKHRGWIIQEYCSHLTSWITCEKSAARANWRQEDKRFGICCETGRKQGYRLHACHRWRIIYCASLIKSFMSSFSRNAKGPGVSGAKPDGDCVFLNVTWSFDLNMVKLCCKANFLARNVLLLQHPGSTILWLSLATVSNEQRPISSAHSLNV